MLLIVDRNEQSTNPRVFQDVKKHFSSVVVADLPHRIHGGTTVTAGDINIPLDDGNLLAIERKTPHDFLQSISSGHIFDQVEVMAQNSKFSAIIVTGFFTYTDKTDIVMIEGEKTNWKGRAVRATMNVIQYSGCPVIFCPPSKYCQMIEEIYSTVNKPDKRQAIRKNRIITFPPVDLKVEILCSFPGVGIKAAESLLKFAGQMENNADEYGYGTLSAAIHWATILSQIDKSERPAGWGPAKILTFRKMLGLSAVQYMGLNEEKEEIQQKED